MLRKSLNAIADRFRHRHTRRHRQTFVARGERLVGYNRDSRSELPSDRGDVLILSSQTSQ
jgi:hypothetical protein